MQVEAEQSKDYIEIIKSNFFSEEDLEKVQVVEEVPYSESDDFMSML